MISGLNHITIAVSQLQRSLDFYQHLLNFTPEVKWKNGAYLSQESLWLCLSLDTPKPAQDYTHLAFSVAEDDFDTVAQRIVQAQCQIWKSNHSEGKSLYFLDPDGHKLEIHVGNLAQRLASLKVHPYQELEWLNHDN